MNGNIKQRRAQARAQAIANRRLTLADRAGIAVLLAVTGVAVLAFALTEGGYSCNPLPVKVKYGDSISTIAYDNCTGNVPRAIDDLVAKYGTTIHNGQVIRLESKGK